MIHKPQFLRDRRDRSARYRESLKNLNAGLIRFESSLYSRREYADWWRERGTYKSDWQLVFEFEFERKRQTAETVHGSRSLRLWRSLTRASDAVPKLPEPSSSKLAHTDLHAAEPQPQPDGCLDWAARGPGEGRGEKQLRKRMEVSSREAKAIADEFT